jgi:hypothetical protein
MNNAFNTFAPRTRRTPDLGIDWESPPSLQHLVRRTEAVRRDAPTWAETMPAPFDAMNEPVSFREPLEGLSVRDLDEPEIFNVFFGDAKVAA